MYCTHCGHQNPPDANFCGQCGRSVDRTADGTTGAFRFDEAPGDPDERELEGLEEVAELRPGTALLVVTRGDNEGARFLLERDLVTAGRHPDSDIFLDDITVSRRHAEFRREQGRFHIRDAGSLNGTYVNGERADERVLTTGDEVQIGKFKLIAFVGEQEQ